MMSVTKNVFISHIHEDDAMLPDLKSLISNAGMDVRDGSITSEKPNDAHNENYIMYQIIAPRIQWASTLIVLISPETKDHPWVDREIEYAVRQGKPVIGVYAHGSSDSDLPKALDTLGNAAIVGWQGDRIVNAINGENSPWEKSDGSGARKPRWLMTYGGCK